LCPAFARFAFFAAFARTSSLLWLTVIAVPAASGPLAPAQERATFRLADPQLVIEMAAAEPEVVSPVAIAWDAAGRLFVAEMSDYPNSPEKGRVKLLTDHDGDGRFERATVFATGLPFPNGVLPWNGGVLVTAAPDIWFLKDHDADGVADERRKILTGFAEGNQQLRVNGLMWGLDNWIYGANGRSDGEIRWADARGSNEPPVSIRGRDFRFRPATRQFEAIAGRSQFGLARDDWGQRFLSWNTIPIRHEVLTERHLSRNKFLGATESVLDLMEPGDAGRVFPLTPPPLTFNQESVRHFNALAGLTIYRGDALGSQYRGSAFVGETLLNLVHRRVLEPSGPTFVSRRGEPEREREFLASTDPWFHPVNFATGPDGALYVVDFYRQFVEHPDFVHPAGVRGTVAWRTGSEHGRLWRIRRRDSPPSRSRRLPDLSRASTGQLVKHLEQPNGWGRDTAQRLLVERRDPAAPRALEKLARQSASPQARLHALCTLEGLQRLTPGLLRTALKDGDVRVQAHAVQLGGQRLGNVADDLLALAPHPDAGVRLQLALALGDWRDARQYAALATLANRDCTNHWHSLAILSGLGESPWLFLAELVKSDARWLRGPREEHTRFLEQVARLVGANHTDAELAECLALIQAQTESPPTAQLVLLAGLADGLAQSGTPLHQLLRQPPSPLATHVESLRAILPRASDAALTGQSSMTLRLAALRVVTQARLDAAPAIVRRLLQPDQPPEVQSAAARAFGELGDASFASSVFTNWPALTSAVRRQLLASALRSPATTVALVSALEQGAVALVEVDAATRQALSKVTDSSLKARVTKLWQTAAAPDRESVVRAFQPALQLKGEAVRGAVTFARLCLSCHALQGQGTALGPDLSGLGSRPAETLLVDILDPNRQVPPDFITYSVVTTQGEIVSGLLAAESSTGVTLRRQGLPDETILRRQIRELRAEGKSLMPDGLEQGLHPQDMADLLEFLRTPDTARLGR
jgi:putative membrane-bound dehydrogenase-like protein